ncbi:MAG TPA: hypothetical protein VGP18_04160 [Solirubrobacteraceae bacterium]|jgi:hypothetical protein|nr:hypothetical protein [Solirubrobacteraceae bacterium]
MLQAEDSLPDEAPGGASGGEMERLAAFDEAVAEIAARVEPVYREADGWLEQTRAGLVELLRFCDERPETARALVVDSIAWGPQVLARRSQLLEALADVLDRGCEQLDPAAAPSLETAASLVGASLSWVQTRLVTERGSFVELVPSLMSMIAHPYRGPLAAKRELERTLADPVAETAAREPEGAASRSFEDKLLTNA